MTEPMLFCISLSEAMFTLTQIIRIKAWSYLKCLILLCQGEYYDPRKPIQKENLLRMKG